MFNELPTCSDSFYKSILTHSLFALKANTFFDNFDAERFNLDGGDHSKEFSVGTHVFYFDWFFKNYQDLFAAYSLLNDDASKKLYLSLIAFRLAGHLSIRLPVNFVGRQSEYEAYKQLEHSVESELPLNGMFGKLRHFDFEYRGERCVADCLSLEACVFRGQYFFSRNGKNVCPTKGDFVIPMAARAWEIPH